MYNFDQALLNQRMEDDKKDAEMFLSNVFCKNTDLASTVYDAMSYSLFAGGKRIRPFLAIEVCRALGGDTEKALPLACAVEMIHTYSLIHDDLPCMDDDDLRRGRPTNHKVFGEAVAVLAGDALLTHAFKVATLADLPSDVIVECIRMISDAAGVPGMIGGQIVDIESENRSVSEETLYAMHGMKTGALITLSALLGCLAAGKGEGSPEFEAVRAYSEKIGIVFQIVDDILDVISDEKTLGKNIGSDAENGKTTFVSLYGIEAAEKLAKKYTEEAVSLIEKYDIANEGLLGAFAEYLCVRLY